MRSAPNRSVHSDGASGGPRAASRVLRTGSSRSASLSPRSFAVDPPEVFGNWGGYFYNQLSLPRVMGVRMPGATPEAIDLAYFGDHPGVPPYTPHPDDNNEAQSVKLAETMGWGDVDGQLPCTGGGLPRGDAVRDRSTGPHNAVECRADCPRPKPGWAGPRGSLDCVLSVGAGSVARPRRRPSDLRGNRSWPRCGEGDDRSRRDRVG